MYELELLSHVDTRECERKLAAYTTQELQRMYQEAVANREPRLRTAIGHVLSKREDAPVRTEWLSKNGTNAWGYKIDGTEHE